MIALDDVDDFVRFTTWRPLDTQDPLDTVIKFDSTVPFVLASGDYSTEWEQRIEHGRIDLRFYQPVQEVPTDDLEDGEG